MTYYRYRNQTIVFQKGKITLSLTIIFVLVLMTFFYLFETNTLVEKNFELRNYQSFLKEKNESNQKLLVSLMQSRSLASIQEAAKSLNLVSVEKANYLKVLTDFFALSR